MKTSSYGKKCLCGHYESEHVALTQKNPVLEPSDLGILLPFPPDFDLKRSNCQICNCQKFDS